MVGRSIGGSAQHDRPIRWCPRDGQRISVVDMEKIEIVKYNQN